MIYTAPEVADAKKRLAALQNYRFDRLMSDTECIMTCPLCGAIDILEQRGMYATAIKCDKPGDVPREVKLKMYVCGQCGRMFNEMEAKAP